jgi:hypothetical protein
LAWVISGCDSEDLLQFFYLNLLWIATDTIAPIFVRGKLSYGEALRDWVRVVVKNPAPDLANSIKSQNAKSFLLIGFLLFLMFGFSFLTGKGEARRKDDYAVTKDGRVLLRRYGTVIVFGSLDESGNRLMPVVSRADANTVTDRFEIVRIGPLRQVAASTNLFRTGNFDFPRR